jgi:Lipase maturation factor
MDWLHAPDYWLSRLLFQRGLGALYLIAFVVAINQFRPLLGEHGLLPAPRFLERVTFSQAPTLFHLHYSDRWLAMVAWGGAILALAAVVGLPDRAPVLLTILLWFALWGLYLSIVNIGQTFYGFGWESLLLEAGFLAIFLGPATVAPPTLLIWLIRWLLFRVEFGAGLIKLRGDPCWRDLTCLYYHHETQPMPNPLSWFFHHLPNPLHRVEVFGNHVAQLVVPFGLFAPQPVSGIAAAIIVVTQLWLVMSGNFAWLNFITIVLAVAGFSNAWLGAGTLWHGVPPSLVTPAWFDATVIAVSALIVVLSYWPARNLFSRRQLMNYSFNSLHLVNTYGAFGSITRTRYEVVIEGTEEPSITPSTIWKEYEFKGKPGDPMRRPPQIAPYHLRLDWLMWFAAMASPLEHPWFVALAVKLLENDRPTLKLLRRSPFASGPPRFVRALLYRYRFTTPRERRETHAWWIRDRLGPYLPPISLGAAAPD